MYYDASCGIPRFGGGTTDVGAGLGSGVEAPVDGRLEVRLDIRKELSGDCG